MRKKILIGILAVVIIGGFLWCAKNPASLPWHKNASWYAVYLNNNQVYFGHITKMERGTIVLEDVRFAEASEEPAVQRSTSKSFALEQVQEPKITLVRRGDEKLLASDHTLFVNRTSVLYWEKLSPEAEVVKIIKEAK